MGERAAGGVSVDVREAGRRAAAVGALRFVRPGEVVGVGTGATAAAFVDVLETLDQRPTSYVASSLQTANMLWASGMQVVPLPESGRLDVYVDGADQADPLLRLIKGGGGAHFREKVLASAAKQFVCIADETKLVDRLGSVPLPIEVLPFARHYVTRVLTEMGGEVAWREAFMTDNDNEILDVRGLDLSKAREVECRLECIPGIVACGLFGIRPADVMVVGSPDGSSVEMQRPGC